MKSTLGFRGVNKTRFKRMLSSAKKQFLVQSQRLMVLYSNRKSYLRKQLFFCPKELETSNSYNATLPMKKNLKF
jgi:hypothetical protein